MTNPFRAQLEALPPVEGKTLALQAIAVGQYLMTGTKTVIESRVKEAKAFLRDSGHMTEGSREYAKIDGEEVATVSYRRGSESWKIVDEEAYGKWLESTGREKNIWTLRPKARTMTTDYLNLLKKVLEETGELPDGVEIETRAGVVSASQSKKQVEALDGLAVVATFQTLTKQITEGALNEHE